MKSFVKVKCFRSLIGNKGTKEFEVDINPQYIVSFKLDEKGNRVLTLANGEFYFLVDDYDTIYKLIVNTF